MHKSATRLLQCPNAVECIVESLREKPSLLVLLLQKLVPDWPYEGLAPGDIRARSTRWVAWYDN